MSIIRTKEKRLVVWYLRPQDEDWTWWCFVKDAAEAEVERKLLRQSGWKVYIGNTMLPVREEK